MSESRQTTSEATQPNPAGLFNDTSEYADIIAMPRPVSKHHLPMPQSDRAAQFAPFAALTGYNELIEKQAKIYAHKHYPTAAAKQAVTEQLQQLAAVPELPVVVLDYFNDDVGYYQSVTSQLLKLDWQRARIYLETPHSVPMANIRSVSIATQSGGHGRSAKF
ncbi:hypothetical protein [Lactiplantibacillus pentosus]|uniref:hypothetical protein n=1 Tax=Lactiplantibacillus pentosus TaxID=1589 RepID=UPI00132F9D72|nr:hypothetical protein [Lactiplantibacillus pentosus]